ncbi:MAG: shikimate dehydrogenase [Candidatus Omnitrophica bacterium]|nr:shikimate dehydrogenase [Candidatus Omnitrophota bacterium]MBU4487856.1 shikimate dehydrogenase [Candidatus Omnitrophota bacterium]MCG2704639.1 shikimate dehydrogenase [Candidatus Omnitrophota bacterium]
MRINGSTELYGIIGYPAHHTFSPAMHNAAFQSLGINAAYVAFEVKPKDLGSAMQCLKVLGIRGLNVTVPYKEAVLKYLDDVEKEAELIGAVNTIALKDGKPKGFNTDGKGFVKSLQEEFGILPKGKRFFIIGAGGASRAISFSLALQGAGRITLVDDAAEKSAALAKAVSRHTSCEAIALKKENKAIKEMVLNSDVLVNATPCGMKVSDPRVIEPNFIHKGLLVYDAIYNPRTTTLLRDARNRGAVTANGMGMLLNQGTLAFTIWTGKKAPIHLMKKALSGVL